MGHSVVVYSCIALSACFNICPHMTSLSSNFASVTGRSYKLSTCMYVFTIASDSAYWQTSSSSCSFNGSCQTQPYKTVNKLAKSE